MSAPSRNRPYLDRSAVRPLNRATTATLALTAVRGDEDQVPVVRPYVTDPWCRELRRAANRVRTYQAKESLLLLGLLAMVQQADWVEGAQ